MTLENQTVLVTGCSTGIGRALAIELLRGGHHVIATARRLETIEDLAQDHERCDVLRLDVTDTSSIHDAVAGALEKAGRLDVLVNNAGLNVFGPTVEVPLEDFRRLFETNVTGLLAVTQAVFPHMASRRRGRIVNVGSVVGILPTPFAGGYCATKAAVHMLSDVMRMEVSPFGIDVVVVQPGGVRSSIADNASEGLERYSEETSRYRKVHRHILRRAGSSQDRPMEADDFARAVVPAFLADRAPRVVRAGRGAAILPRLRALPGAVLDRVMIRQFGLGELAED